MHIGNILDREEEMTEWIECKISDIGTVVGGATPSTKKSENYQDGIIPWITPKDLATFRGRYIKQGERKITETGLKSCSTQLLPKNTVLFSSRAPIGYIAIAANEVCTNQGFKSVIPNENIDPLFLFYLLKYNKDIIEGMGSGTTFKEVSGTTMKNIVVNVPKDKVMQEKIASIIGSIDDKIEENEKINNNLEQQMRALFRSLFVDNAKSTWKEGVLSDLGTIVAGGTPSKSKPEYYAEQGIAWITPKDLSLNKSKFISHGENDISEFGFSKSSVTKMPAGTVLFSSRAPIGYIAIAANELTTNQGFKSIVPNENTGTAFLYFLLKWLLPIIERMASGSTFKEISGAGMKSVPVVIPDNKIIKQFNDFCNPFFQQQKILESENIRLSNARDVLLPKLMTGEIDVSDLEL